MSKLKTHVDQLDSVDESLRQHYEPDAEDGGFRLMLDMDQMRAAKRREKDMRIAVETHNRELTRRVRDLEAAGAVVKPDDQLSPREKFIRENARRLSPYEPGSPEYQAEFARIEADMEPLIAAELAEVQAQGEKELQRLESTIRKLTIEQAAVQILGDIAKPGCADLLKPHLLSRLACTRVEEQWQASVVDVDGKPLAISIEGLKDEFSHTPSMASIVKGANKSEAANHARRVAAVLGAATH